MELTVGQTDVPVKGTVKAGGGTGVIDLSGYQVTFSMRPVEGGALKVTDQPASGSADGTVTYSFAAVDVDTAGRYLGQFTATKDGRSLYIPSNGTILITIYDQA